jgi:predicted esterase
MAGAAFAAGAPVVTLVGAADAAQWKKWAEPLGWQVIAPAAAADNIDARVQALASAVHDAVSSGAVDRARVYVAGRGDGAASVFYAISRLPDMFAAGVAVGGSPQPAIDTGRVFSANFTNAPVLWVSDGAGDEALAGRLKSGGMNVEWRSSSGLEISALFDWLAGHARRPFPPEADCETNSPAFASCFWLEPMKFDMNERNDVLPSTRILAGSAAALDLGGFGYKLDEAGPGILVSYLPQKYSGPLKMGDRIMEIEGKAIANARQYREIMSKYTEEKRVVILVQRGKNRERIETRVVPQRFDAAPSARVQGKYDLDDKLVLVVSRAVTGMRVTVPEEWVGSGLMWNGLSMEKIEKTGCILLTIDKELMHAAPCD